MSGQRIPVRIGELRVGQGGAVLFTIGLGSCVAVALYDTVRRVGGLAHVVLPTRNPSRPDQPAGRFAESAVPELVARMRAAGAARARLRARITGGASMFTTLVPESGITLGQRNVAAVKAALNAACIPLDGEDTGGDYGRSVFLHTGDGRMLVRSVMHADVEL